MGLNDTPQSERIHIGFFGRTNAGKSSLVNKITNQDLAIVSDTKGTTTDPVYKAMELLLTTDEDIENIAKSLGIDDASYFSRWFKKSCGIPPAECRKYFLKNEN